MSFNPSRGSNQVVSPAAASASKSIDPNVRAIRLVNSGVNICYVRWGVGAQTATTADVPVAPGWSETFVKAYGDDTVAYISAVGTTLNIQTGEDDD